MNHWMGLGLGLVAGVMLARWAPIRSVSATTCFSDDYVEVQDVEGPEEHQELWASESIDAHATSQQLMIFDWSTGAYMTLSYR